MGAFKDIRQTPEVTDIVNRLTNELRYVEPPYDAQLFMSGNSESSFALGVQNACKRIMVNFNPVVEVFINEKNDVDCMLDENYEKLMTGESRYAPAAATAAARVVKELAETYPVYKVVVVGHGRIGRAVFKLLDDNHPVVTLQAHNDLIHTDGSETLVNCTPSKHLSTTNGVRHLVDVDGSLGGGHVGPLTCAILARRAHHTGGGAIRQLEYSQI